MAEQVPPDAELDRLRERLATTEAALAAAQRTIDVLIDRVERPVVGPEADRFALYKSISTLQNIARERARQAEVQSLDYAALVEAIPDATLTLDSELRVLSANPAADRLFESGTGPLPGRPLPDLLGLDGSAALTGLLWSGFSGVGESELELDDGRLLGLSVARLPEERILLLLRDVTLARQQQQELRRSRRLASAGRLASGLVRDITTPLSIVQGRVSLVHSQAEHADSVRRHAGVAETHCMRIATVMRNLQTFVAPRPLDRARHSVVGLLEEVTAERGPSIDAVELRVEAVPDALEVHADRAQLLQALSNLLSHVLERSPSGVQLRFGAWVSGEGNGAVEFRLEAPCEVLPPAVMAELRSPYAEGERQFDPDLGLGLAIAWAIVQDHGGWLTVEEQGEGVAFRVFIPGAPPDDEMHGGTAVDADAAAGLILVVDDDHLLRETVTWMLEDGGHTIATVATAEDALAWLETHSPDAVLVDIGLPGMRGDALVDAMAERWPHLASRTVVTSGLLHAPRQGEAYLQKPFTRVQLLGMLERILKR